MRPACCHVRTLGLTIHAATVLCKMQRALALLPASFHTNSIVPKSHQDCKANLFHTRKQPCKGPFDVARCQMPQIRSKEIPT